MIELAAFSLKASSAAFICLTYLERSFPQQVERIKIGSWTSIRSRGIVACKKVSGTKKRPDKLELACTINMRSTYHSVKKAKIVATYSLIVATHNLNLKPRNLP